MSENTIQQIQAIQTAWKDIDPTWDIHDSLPSAAAKGIGWMKLKFRIADTLKQRLFAIQIQQSIAAEYYLNGQLLTRYGVVSPIPTLVKASDAQWKPVAFPVKFDAVNTLLIRFSVQPKSRYTQVFETTNPIAFIQLKPHKEAIDTYTRLIHHHTIFQYLLLGMCLMIFIIHLSFYLMYPLVKANLWFALSRILYIIGQLLQIKFYLFSDFINEKYWLGLIAFSMFLLSNLFTMIAILQFLHCKFDWIDKLVFLLFIPVVFLIAIPYGWGWRSAALLQVLIHVNLIRIAILTRKKNQTNALIIGLGTFVTILLFFVFISMGTFENVSFIQSFQWQRMVIYLLYTLGLPVALSFFLAREFAQTTRTLTVKLSEVEALSAQTIAQEQEKQHLLATQNETLERLVIERTAELKASQNQLIQSEKLASLGELTAGIAHEIQNPLNFVNNFAEVSAEMLVEMDAELDKGDVQEAKAISADLKTNLEKINHHGKRASAIVKGMLEHSRTSTGVKEPTDLNVLADEYLRLAYHGLRAKDSSFNATLETHFNPDLPLVSVIPQDIGRVLLNLINNAFYAVTEKAKQGIEGYSPTVTISTRWLSVNTERSRSAAEAENAIEINVKDNGNGIPDAIRDKIFQPFFTTKPTGQGTGLGLSLAYDIVTKGHGGSLDVESTIGEGSEFIILLSR
jgi:signal transduction histidine kinase